MVNSILGILWFFWHTLWLAAGPTIVVLYPIAGLITGNFNVGTWLVCCVFTVFTHWKLIN